MGEQDDRFRPIPPFSPLFRPKSSLYVPRHHQQAERGWNGQRAAVVKVDGQGRLLRCAPVETYQQNIEKGWEEKEEDGE